MESLVYPYSPVSSVRALSGLLQIPVNILLDVAAERDKLYKQNKPEKKPDGRERITYRLDDKLKFIQDRIKTQIFNQVIYPGYLQGSIKDINNPRTYDRDANIHAGSNLIISEDVSDFFHSIDEKHVREMWKYLFKFTPDVAELLTRLTTYNGYVPQGGVTSSYISNLIMWDVEPQLVETLNRIGITYTRYVDDITLSSKLKWLPQNDLETSIKTVYGMLAVKGVKPNRKKHQIMGKSVKMKIHKLLVNSGRPTMEKQKRSKIRLEVFNMKKIADSCGRKGAKYITQFSSVTGKVRELSKFHPTQAKKHIAELQQISPI